MTTKLTRSEVLALEPCDLRRVPEFGDLDRMGAQEALDAGVSISDLLWVAGALGMKRQCVQFALECAQRVEQLNPDPRVQGTLDAVGTWLVDPSEENRQGSETAARAAWGARTTWGARTAAWAADWAAWAAAGSAAAASNAAVWAAWAAAESAATEAAAAGAAAGAEAEAAEAYAQREIFLRIFN